MNQSNNQSIGWQYQLEDGSWHFGQSTHNHRQNTERAGYPVRDVYAIPEGMKLVPLEPTDAMIDAVAAVIYNQWPNSKQFPWQPGGNSDRQHTARDLARAALFNKG